MTDSAVHARPKPRARKKPASKRSRTRKPAPAKKKVHPLPDTTLDVLANAAAEAVALAVSGVRVGAERLGPVLLNGTAGLVELGRHLARQRDVQRVAATAALAAGVIFASQAIDREVRTWPQFAVDRSAFGATSLPAELSEQAHADLARLPLPPNATAFDPSLPAVTAACLADLPWVQQVDRVEVRPPNRLGFAVRARRPIAQLGEGEHAALVTADGVVIPRIYGARPDLLPRFLGVASDPEGRLRGLQAGLRVLETLADASVDVVAIDLSNLNAAKNVHASEVVVVLANGLTVEWGRAGGARPQVEGARKREVLEAFLRDGPDLAQVARLSVRWDEPTYVLRESM